MYFHFHSLIFDLQSNGMVRYVMVTLNQLSYFSITEVKEWVRIASRLFDNMVKLGYPKD